MSQDGGPGPVRRFRVATSDEAEAEDFIRRMYIDNRARFLRAGGDTRFTVRLSATEGLAVSRLRATVDFRTFTEPFDHHLFLSVTHGQVRVRAGGDDVVLRAGDQSRYPLGVPLDVALFDMGVRAVQLPAERLAATAEHSAGIAAADFRFESATPVSPRMAGQWAALTDLAARVLLTEGAEPAALVTEELSRTAAITALHTFPNTALTAGHRPRSGWVAPAAVRRAAEFIEAHADRPIRVEQIAAAAGVSGPALRDAFRRHLDVGPMEYLRRIRLERADQELRDGGAGPVADVARRWGWADPDRFVADYRRRFGVAPRR